MRAAKHVKKSKRGKMQTLKEEKLKIEFDLEVSKSLIQKDLGFRVLLENSQYKSNPEIWDFDDLVSAEAKFNSLELIS